MRYLGRDHREKVKRISLGGGGRVTIGTEGIPGHEEENSVRKTETMWSQKGQESLERALHVIQEKGREGHSIE